MTRLTRYFQHYFGFSRTELRGITVLLLLLVLIWVFPLLLRWIIPSRAPDMAFYREEIRAFLATADQQEVASSLVPQSAADVKGAAPSAPVYFFFDPNTLEENGWHKLGLSGRQIRNILNYRQSGGIFRKKEDLKKMYTLAEDDYLRLEPYIRISSSAPAERQVFTHPASGTEAIRQGRDAKTVNLTMELNTADSLLLQQLPGIGPVYASRIVRYRERLGGFLAVTQLLDVYGMDSARYERLLPHLTLDTVWVRRIDVNKATFEQLRSHPFITPKQANAIVQYRKQHGRFRAADDLSRIVVLDEHSLQKMKPYLTVE